MDTTTTISPALKSHLLSLYQIAMSDDHFSVSELEMLYQLAEEKGLTKEDLGGTTVTSRNAWNGIAGTSGNPYRISV